MAGNVNAKSLCLVVPSTLTITAGGAITITQTRHVVAANGGGADDLDTIAVDIDNRTLDGDTCLPFLFLVADTGDTITVRHGQDNIYLNTAANFTLSGTKTLLLVPAENGTDWYGIDQGSASAAPVDATYITQTANGTLTNEQAMSALASGVVTNDTGTGVLAVVNTKAGLEGEITDVDDFAEADGDTYTGVHDFGGADSLEIPNSAAPTVDAAGEIAVDTTIADYTGLIKYYDGVEELTVVAMPTANLSTTDGDAVVYDAANDEFTMEAVGGGLFSSYAVICDQKAQNTAGGTFTSGAWRTRDLNTEIVDDDTIVTIASNQFTLPNAGTYLIKWWAPAYRVDEHLSKLYDITGTADIAFGKNARAAAADGSMTDSIGWAQVTIGSSNTYEIRHQCTTTRNTDGFGELTNFAVEKYTVVEIWKVA